MKRLIRVLLGGLFLLLGLAGLVLPVVPGLLFLAMGGIVLSRDVRIFGAVEHWITARFPKADRAMDRLRKIFSILH